MARQDYYARWHGQRVELNAMTSRQFLDWLEAKFAEHGVEKVVPDEATLANAYQHLARNAVLQRAINMLLADLPAAETFTVPEGLAETLRTTIAGTTASWDQALWQIARGPSMRMATPSSRPPHDSPAPLGAATRPEGAFGRPGRTPTSRFPTKWRIFACSHAHRGVLRTPSPSRIAPTPFSPLPPLSGVLPACAWLLVRGRPPATPARPRHSGGLPAAHPPYGVCSGYG